MEQLAGIYPYIIQDGGRSGLTIDGYEKDDPGSKKVMIDARRMEQDIEGKFSFYYSQHLIVSYSNCC